MVRDFDQAITEELARIDQLEREAWGEWERSKTVREKSKTTKAQRQKGDESTAQLEREGRLGDPRYLERVAWCIERRIKLLGLDAPERRELSGPGGGPIQVAAASLSDEDLAVIAARGLPPAPAEAACAEQPVALLESSPEPPADSGPK
jgi:hypothetical protein